MNNPYSTPMEPIGKPNMDLPKSLAQSRPGWATFLGIALTILAPIRSLLMTFNSISQTEAQNPVLLGNAEWQQCKVGSWIGTITFLLLGMYVGYKLLFVPLRSTISLAKICIWVVGPLGIVMVNYGVGYWSFGNRILTDDVHREVMGMLAPSIFFAILWTLYLFKSKKVQAYYR